MKRNCTNCAFCERFKYSSKDETEMMRCWQEPGVCDHAFVQTMNDAKDYVCDEHRTEKEREKTEEQPKITINEETGETTVPIVGSHKDYYIPPKTEVEEIKGTDLDGGVIGEEGVDGMKILKETEEKPIEEHEEEYPSLKDLKI